MKKIIYVTGMDCNHCSRSAEEALSAIEGVTRVKADREKGTVTVTMKNDIDDKLLIDAVESLGFTPGEITIKAGIFG